MGITGELMKKSEEGGEATGTPQLSKQYILCVLNVWKGTANTEDGPQQTHQIKYTKKAAAAVKRLAIVQVLCGLLMLLTQVTPTYFWVMINSEVRDISFSVQYQVMDQGAAGIWAGLFILLTGIIGLAASRNNNRGLIITHLVLNIFAILLAITVIVFCVMTSAELIRCKTGGVGTWSRNDDDYHRYDYNYGRTSTTAKPQVVDIFGEIFVLGKRNQYFYCTAKFFCVWLGLEFLMVVSSVITIISTIWLIVKNAMATCLCCFKCCQPDTGSKFDDRVPIVTAVEE